MIHEKKRVKIHVEKLSLNVQIRYVFYIGKSFSRCFQILQSCFFLNREILFILILEEIYRHILQYLIYNQLQFF